MSAGLSVCVLGGGTAGSMAAAHISRNFPNITLTHIFDSRIPAIGVGEGTTPPFHEWIHDITGLTLTDLRERAFVTVKEGIRFENWGQRHPTYNHLFAGAEGHAYHISADRIGELLRSRSKATVLDHHVADVTRRAKGAAVRFDDGSEAEFDLVIDARGFPAALDHRHIAFQAIPTNAALLQRCRTVIDQPFTRAVARPFGWIFCIPLSRYTSCGYIFNSKIDSPDRVSEDFDAFLADQNLQPESRPRTLPFPNFARRQVFDGGVFYIGNAASFLEPLEATAITVVLYQLRLVSAWLITRLTDWGGDDCVHILDRQFAEFMEQVGWFVSWHYARGSVYDTEFWRIARKQFDRAREQAADRPSLEQFRRFVRAGGEMEPGLALAQDREHLRALETSANLEEAYGGFIVDSFAKVGHGIGYYR